MLRACAESHAVRLSGRVMVPCSIRVASEIGYRLPRINVICLLLALIGTTAIVKHPAWFGVTPAAQSLAKR